MSATAVCTPHVQGRAYRVVVGCERCGRWTRAQLGVEGMVYPHHRPGCPAAGVWVAAKRCILVGPDDEVQA
jgi:hypothetical protein